MSVPPILPTSCHAGNCCVSSVLQLGNTISLLPSLESLHNNSLVLKSLHEKKISNMGYPVVFWYMHTLLCLFLVFLSPHACSCHWGGNSKSFLSLLHIHPALWQFQQSPCFTDQRVLFLSSNSCVHWLDLPHVPWLLFFQSLPTTLHSLVRSTLYLYFMDERDLVVLIFMFFEVISCNVIIFKSIVLSTQDDQAELLYPCSQEMLTKLEGYTLQRQ